MSPDTASGPQTGLPSSSSLDPLETTQHPLEQILALTDSGLPTESGWLQFHPLVGTTTQQRRIIGDDRSQWFRIIAAFTLNPPTSDARHDGPDIRWCRRLTRICECCRFPRLVRSSSEGVALRAAPCRDRCCPRCASSRAKRVADRITELTKRMNSPRFLTLTIKTDGLLLEDAITKLMDAFRKLRRRPEWKSKVVGGVYTIEVTRGARGDRWHPHLHCIIDGEYWSQQVVSDLWKQITEDSCIVDIRAIHDRRRTAEYIGQYVGKPIGWERWSLEHLTEFAQAMQGKRLVHTFGNLHNAKVDPPDELLADKHDSPLCTVSEFYRLIERGMPDALCAWDIMQGWTGPMGAITRRLGTRPLWSEMKMPTPDERREVARLISDALADLHAYDGPAPPPPPPPPPHLPGLLD